MDVIREIYRGDIFYVMPGPAYAAEIGTKGRPAVIVSPSPDRTSCETVNVVYLTTRPQAPSPVHVRICSSAYPSTALCEQVNSVHIDRLGNFYAAVTGEEMRAIDRALLVALGLDPEAVHEGARKEPTIAGGSLPVCGGTADTAGDRADPPLAATGDVRLPAGTHAEQAVKGENDMDATMNLVQIKAAAFDAAVGAVMEARPSRPDAFPDILFGMNLLIESLQLLMDGGEPV